MRRTLLLLLALALQLSAAEWRWSVGANFGSFDDVALKGFALNRGGALDGSVDALGGGLWRYTVRDPLNQVGGTDLDEVTYRRASFSGEHDGIGRGTGVAVGGTRVLRDLGPGVLALDLTLTTAGSSSCGSFAAMQELETWSIAADSWNPGVVPDADKLVAVSANHTPAASPPILNSLSTVSYDLDMGIYTIGAGLSLSRQVREAQISVSTGPAASAVDYDLRRTAVGEWLGGGTFHREQRGSDGWAFRAGWYAGLGLACDVSERLGLGLGLRYD